MSAWDWFSAVSNASSILSLFVSLFAAWQITRVKRQIISRVRLPQVIESLERNAASLSAELGQIGKDPGQLHSGEARVLAALAICSANIRAIPSSTAPIRNAVWSLRWAFRVYRWRKPDLERAWRLHVSLLGLIQLLRNLKSERDIGGM